MPRPVTAIANLGPAMAEAFARAGITTADEIERLGVDAAYGRLLDTGERPHFIAYYALAMGLMGRPWNDCRGAEKEALRARFDALKTAARPAGGDPLAAILDEIGLLPPRR